MEADNASSDNDLVTNDKILLDVNGDRVINDFSPYRFADQTVSYFGLESYEVNRIGNSSKWQFNENNVRKMVTQ